MTERNAPSESEMMAYMDSLSNWGRWGPDDELGTLNLITPQKKTAAAALVTEGIGVSCARPIIPEIASDTGTGRIPPMHYMLSSGEAAPASGPGRSLRLHRPLFPRLDHHPPGLHLPPVLGRQDVQRQERQGRQHCGQSHSGGHPTDQGRHSHQGCASGRDQGLGKALAGSW